MKHEAAGRKADSIVKAKIAAQVGREVDQEIGEEPYQFA